MDIVAVRVIEGRTVHLCFKDGTQHTVDLAPYLRGPIFEQVCSDRELFEAVRVDPEAGTIVRPNGADLAPDVLYTWLPSARSSSRGGARGGT